VGKEKNKVPRLCLALSLLVASVLHSVNQLRSDFVQGLSIETDTLLLDILNLKLVIGLLVRQALL